MVAWQVDAAQGGEMATRPLSQTGASHPTNPPSPGS